MGSRQTTDVSPDGDGYLHFPSDPASIPGLSGARHDVAVDQGQYSIAPTGMDAATPLLPLTPPSLTKSPRRRFDAHDQETVPNYPSDTRVTRPSSRAHSTCTEGREGKEAFSRQRRPSGKTLPSLMNAARLKGPPNDFTHCRTNVQAATSLENEGRRGVTTRSQTSHVGEHDRILCLPLRAETMGSYDTV